MTSRFVFLVGTGRCGSTLVHELVARHHDVGFLSNVEDRLRLPAATGRVNGRLLRALPPSATTKGRIRFGPSEGYRALASEVSPAVVDPIRDLVASDATPWLADRTRQFFVRRAAAQDRPVFVHKFTGWPRAAFLDAVLDDVRFVHVVRDGRAVASSWLQMPWWRGHRGPEGWHWGRLPVAYEAEWLESGRSFPLLAGLAWKVLVDATCAAREAVGPDRWLDVRFEDVVSDRDAVLAGIMRFIGLAPSPRFDAAVRRVPLHTARLDGYRTQLAIDDVAALTASLRGHLARFAYD